MPVIFESTRDRSVTADLGRALLEGMAPDRGLYLPRSLPRVGPATWRNADRSAPAETAFRVLAPLLGEAIPHDALAELLDQAMDFPIPVVRLTDRIHVLELHHGPTMAFKDVAARTMARWIGWFRRGADQPLTVLVATSGDTGGAVASAFAGIEGVRVIVLFPRGRVTDVQEAQMTTLGEPVTAIAVEGSFDDCQRLAKQAFADRSLRNTVELTSANSINIGRLLPQIAYYFHAAAQLDSSGGPPIYAVPSGNLGNLTAGLLAARMGLPCGGFVAGVNANRVFPDFLASGRYLSRPSFRTLSNAMDVGDPSNLERIRSLYDRDMDALRRDVSASSWNDRATGEAIVEVLHTYGYLMDPHTAVGFLALSDRMEHEPPERTGVLLSTAHPAKFAETITSITGRRPETPPQLAACLQQPRQLIRMAPELDALRAILFG